MTSKNSAKALIQKFGIFFLGWSLLSLDSFASGGFVSSRFIPTTLMPSGGKFAGQRTEYQRRRALVPLTAGEKAKLGVDRSARIFANLRHKGKFFIGIFPKANVTQSVVSQVKITKKHWAAQERPEAQSIEVHSELDFEFHPSKGVKLVAEQILRNEAEESRTEEIRTLPAPEELAALVLSVEAVRSAREPMAPFIPASLGPNFAVMARIVSAAERDLQHLEDPSRIVRIHTLDFSRVTTRAPSKLAPADALWERVIRENVTKGASQTYDVVRKNCTNSLFQLLDETLSYPPFDETYVRRASENFVRVELPLLGQMLGKMGNLEEHGIVWNEIGQLTGRISAKLEEDLKQQEKLGLDFYWSFPGLIDGHLIGRGLLAPDSRALEIVPAWSGPSN
jgi:hypothetical protein